MAENKIIEYRGEYCRNCGTPLERADKYCHQCGQLNSTKKLQFHDFFNEFFSGVFAYDSRFQRTLRVLLFSPGKISKDYIRGKRTYYANPFRFYLSASIVFFLVFGFMYVSENDLGPRDLSDRIALDSLRQKKFEELQTEEDLDSISLNFEEGKGLDIEEFVRPKTYDEYYKSEAELDTVGIFSEATQRFNLYYEFQEETGIYHSDRALDSLKHHQTKFNQFVYKKAVDAGLFRNNPSLFFNYFVGKLPFIIFFFLPLFALFIWLLYVRRKFNYMEHLIFTFHVQTTFFIVYLIALLLFYIINSSWVINIATLLFLFYLYKAMRNFYGQGRVKTFLKFILLNCIFFTLAVIATLFSLLASFGIY